MISTLDHINSQKFIFTFSILELLKILTSQILSHFTFKFSKLINFLSLFIGIKISTIFHDNFIFEEIDIFAL
jgi:Na+-transporting NADH:ubiquinone oxidoreductase subunit NqrD